MNEGGGFQIDVWHSSYPIWVEILYAGKLVCRINALELRNLEHAVGMARREASRVAEQMDPLHTAHY